MAAIEAAIREDRRWAAVQQLKALLKRRPDSDEARYSLGTSLMELGRPEPADEAWARVTPGSPFAARALLGRMEIRMGRGDYAGAERIIRDAMDDPRLDASELSAVLGPIYLEQGRLEETLRLIEARWEALDRAGEGASESALKLVREYIHLRQDPLPLEVIRSNLERATSLSPRDDRVWLARAHLAIRTGAYDEAARWLEACLRSRPDDVPVWRARLDWAVATDRLAEAQEATKHLPATEATPARVERWAAWLAARRGDRAAEHRALERLVAAAPADLPALDRLAVLDTQNGRTDLAAERRRQRAEIERLDARYRELYRRNQPRRDAVEMARLAQRLGYWFEARVFLTRAIAVQPERHDLGHELAGITRRVRMANRPGRTLADLLASEPEAPVAPPTSPARSSTGEHSRAASVPRPEAPGRTEDADAPG
jgi:tetratricopeptide (TPR) repeat protein